MDRRDILKSALVLATAGASAAAAAETTSNDVSAQKVASTQNVVSAQKVVYHLSEMDRVPFVLGNIHNHIDALGERLTLALVVHGPPLRAFRGDAGNMATKEMVTTIKASGARLYACIHTMEGMKITLADLLPGFEVADKGGVVKLTELQMQGYAYLRP